MTWSITHPLPQVVLTVSKNETYMPGPSYPCKS
jgi:hypothetical protein